VFVLVLLAAAAVVAVRLFDLTRGRIGVFCCLLSVFLVFTAVLLVVQHVHDDCRDGVRILAIVVWRSLCSQHEQRSCLSNNEEEGIRNDGVVVEGGDEWWRWR
jgi:sensor histidine kinase regulating citrate/malate metabolism